MKRTDEAAVRRRSAKAPERGLGLLLAVLCLLAVICASTAFAEDTDEPGQNAASFVPGWTSQEAQEEAAQASPPKFLAPPTDSQAAEALPHDDLGRAEASDLLTAVFGEVLDEAAGIFDELEVEQFHSDYTAVVGGGESVSPGSGEADQPALLTSLLPLRAENSEGEKAPVDLALQHIEGDLRPENPLVEVEIPSEIDQGISLPEAGVTIDLANAPAQRSVSSLGETTAFYPNVAPDSDLTVLPTPTGIETSTVLRTPEAPVTQTYDLAIPPGAHLGSTKEGGAVVSKDGETLLVVRAPTALDAEGDPVAATLNVEGSSIVIHAAPGEGDAFPILVDPIYEAYFWNQYPGSESPEWIPSSSPCLVAAWRMWGSQGMSMYSCSNSWVTPGTQATWNYYVPRFFTDMNDPLVKERPTSYIKSMTMSALNYTFAEGKSTYPDPRIIMGIWDGAKNAWVSVASQNGIEGPVVNRSVPFNNGSEVTDAKNAGIALASYEPYMPGQRNVEVGQATIEISDKDYPKISETGNPPAWVNNSATSPITFKATDKGLGMHSLVVGEKKVDGTMQYITTRNKNCDGSARVPCSRSWSSGSGPALSYDPSLMPQGEDWVTVEPVDPLNHRQDPTTPALSEVKIKVDHAPPALGLSGTLTEQAKVGTTAAQYSLNYYAGDGDHAAATAQSPIGTAGTGVGKMQRPMGVAIDSAGNTFVVDRECNCVQKYDSTGKFLSQFGTFGSGDGQFSDPRGIAISASGNIWVSEVGNKRVQQFSPSGNYLQKITYAQFVEPYGLAMGPGETLWVADAAAHRIMRFSQSGTLLYEAHGAPAAGAPAGPVGLASEPNGSVWMTDAANHRLIKFDSTGNYITQFGSAGAGAGQLSSPVGIALAPSGNLLVGDAGNSRVQVFQPNGRFLRKFGASGTGDDQFAEPRGIVLSPSGTLSIADAANRRVTRWTHADLNAQSGVTKVEVKVDNEAPKVFYDQPCAERDCSDSKELLFNPSAYSTGQHKVVVTATDGVKLATPKELIVNTVKDTSPPQLAATNPLYTAPEGWLEQSSYAMNAVASDPGGYGITSLTLKIDGKVVKAATQACPSGGCSLNLAKGVTIDMAGYNGGAHPAELIATDAAGLVTKKEWTVNVAPKGSIGPAEAEDTVEAVEETSGEAVIAPGPAFENPIEEEPAPTLEQENEAIKSEGAPVEATMTTDPSDGFELHTAEGLVSITPVGTGGTPNAPTSGAKAVISGNTSTAVDTVIRPIYDGGMTFQQIRTTAAPEEYTWKVNMFDDQILKQVDAQTAEVYEEDEQEVKHPAFSIHAEPAHDAIGTTVPTTLAVSSGNLVTLKVPYRAGNPAAGGAPFVLPVTAGAGWEGGFVTEYVDIPDEPSEAEEGFQEEEFYLSAPERATAAQAEISPEEAQQNDAITQGTSLALWRQNIDHRQFRWIQCHRMAEWPDIMHRPGGDCGNPFINDEGVEDVAFNYGLRGDYYSDPGVFAKHRGTVTEHIECDKLYATEHLEDQGAANVTYFINPAEACRWYGHTEYSEPFIARNINGNSHHLTPYGEWHWGSGVGDQHGDHWVHHISGLALYIWTAASGYVGHHNTTCIDC